MKNYLYTSPLFRKLRDRVQELAWRIEEVPPVWEIRYACQKWAWRVAEIWDKVVEQPELTWVNNMLSKEAWRHLELIKASPVWEAAAMDYIVTGDSIEGHVFESLVWLDNNVDFRQHASMLEHCERVLRQRGLNREEIHRALRLPAEPVPVQNGQSDTPNGATLGAYEEDLWSYRDENGYWRDEI